MEAPKPTIDSTDPSKPTYEQSANESTTPNSTTSATRHNPVLNKGVIMKVLLIGLITFQVCLFIVGILQVQSGTPVGISFGLFNMIVNLIFICVNINTFHKISD